jgi:hypothetical protein
MLFPSNILAIRFVRHCLAPEALVALTELYSCNQL